MTVVYEEDDSIKPFIETFRNQRQNNEPLMETAVKVCKSNKIVYILFKLKKLKYPYIVYGIYTFKHKKTSTMTMHEFVFHLRC